MPAPALIIGVGGTGLRVLLRVKERFLEAYDRLPPEIVLFELDSDAYTGEKRESFNGVTLLSSDDNWPDGTQVTDNQIEFYQVRTKQKDQKIDSIFKNTDDEWKWVDRTRLTRTIVEPGATTIYAGAGTVRPIGRCALFLDYARTYELLRNRFDTALRHIHGHDNTANIFIVASVAGGSGAGMVIDIMRMIEHIRQNPNYSDKPITVSALLVGGKSFVTRPDGQRTLSNTYAALRELDRLGVVSSRVMVKKVPSVLIAPDPLRNFLSDIGPADNILLFDNPDRLGRTRDLVDQSLGSYLNNVVTPTIADYIMAMSDTSVATKMQSFRKDFAENFKIGRDGRKGHYPYLSAGIHTLIFPERDVRNSAGFKLLDKIWNEYLIRSDTQENNDDKGLRLPVSSANLWGPIDTGLKPNELNPYNFAQFGFSRTTVCVGAGNNRFIQTLVTSSINQQITLPPKRSLQNLFKGRSMLERVLILIGLPMIMEDKGNNDQILEQSIERVNDHFNRSIDELQDLETVADIRNWREKYLGSGALGAEKVEQGLWNKWLLEEATIAGHKRDFADILQNVVEKILNDKDSQGRILPYRLEYAERVLQRLQELVEIWMFSTDQRKKLPSLLVSYFEQASRDEENARKKVQDAEGRTVQAVSSYRSANIEYAKAKRELIGKTLLEHLCGFLLENIKGIKDELFDWRKFLRSSWVIIGERQAAHETNRVMKSQIPVRTYITDPDYEKNLYARHEPNGLDQFRKIIEWKRVSGNRFHLVNAAFAKPIPRELKELSNWYDVDKKIQDVITLTDEQVATRSINWACTTQGNFDREDLPSPFRDMADKTETQMSMRIREHYGTGHERDLITSLTDERRLACLCHLNNWPSDRKVYTACVPSSIPDRTVREFYDKVKTGVENFTGEAVYNARSREMYFQDPENPRHAFAMELAIGFRLTDRQDYSVYASSYRVDSQNLNALHCMPEESSASTYFEPAINQRPDPGLPASRLYSDLNLSEIELDPVVVDLLGDREKLELFVKARACDLISPGGKGDPDFYLYPADLRSRYKLSAMGSPGEIDEILTDVIYTDQQKSELAQGDERSTRLTNRLRLLFALRTFLLRRADLATGKVDNGKLIEGRVINFERLKRDVKDSLDKLGQEELKSRYHKMVDNFKSFYTEYAGAQYSLDILAHLGLVLAKVAFDLENTTDDDGHHGV